MDKIELKPIGAIYTPWFDRAEAPRGPSSSDADGYVVVDEAYAAGLKDLEGFSHIILIFYFDRSETAPLLITPHGTSVERGVFATRSPNRPNHIGVSVVRLKKIARNVLTVNGVDMLDGTPLLDIKPYSPIRDSLEEIRQGWIDEIGGERH
jgi:tRNA-Thr(GGU) m(6)t(6)A37 methyltransferase TsaA